MRNILLLFAVLFILIVIGGIIVFNSTRKPNTAKTESASRASGGKTATIGNTKFTLETADTKEKLQKGLSERDSLPQDRGMLFVFERPGLYPFWMKNMRFPIDIIYIRDNKIATIHNNVPPATGNDAPLYNSEAPADRVLEINAGLSQKNGFKRGDTVTFSQ